MLAVGSSPTFRATCRYCNAAAQRESHHIHIYGFFGFLKQKYVKQHSHNYAACGVLFDINPVEFCLLIINL